MSSTQLSDIDPKDPQAFAKMSDDEVYALRHRMNQLFIPQYRELYKSLIDVMEQRNLKKLKKDSDRVLQDIQDNPGVEYFTKKISEDGALSFVPVQTDDEDLAEGQQDDVDRHQIQKTVHFRKIRDIEQIVTGVVYEPNVIDAHGDWMTPEAIETAMIDFMKFGQDFRMMHAGPVQLVVIENYLAPVDFTVDANEAADHKATTITKGTWILSVYIASDKLWSRITDGSISGFSIGGSSGEETAINPGA